MLSSFGVGCNYLDPAGVSEVVCWAVCDLQPTVGSLAHLVCIDLEAEMDDERGDDADCS